MKKSLDLSAVTAARAALSDTEYELTRIRGSLAIARDRVKDCGVAVGGKEEQRRQVLLAGTDPAAALAEMEQARHALSIAQEDVALLTSAAAEREQAVLEAEHALEAAMTAAWAEQFATTKRELIDAILRIGPAFQAAQVRLGQGRPTVGMMLGDLGEYDLAPLWIKSPPPPGLEGGHRSAILTDEQRSAAR
jgi:hypothetical protein